ncbi:MAG: hypothetical protein ACREM3_29495 [Candidatus Rokuibacteriota bacterium]
MEQVATKWVRNAQGASQSYTEGVTGAGSRWAAAAAAGEQNYRAGVTEAAAAGRFGRGVAKAGGAKYERGATMKGAARFGGGVAAAEQDYRAAVGPVLSTIAGVDLPPAGPRGSAGNYQRVQRIGEALHKLRTGK